LTIDTLANPLVAIREQISFYEHEVRTHPLATHIQHNKQSIRCEQALANYLFMDSWMWPPMLISMRDHVKNPILRKAIEDNLQDEAGGRGSSHIKLCMDFMKSLHFIPAISNLAEINRTINVSCELSEAQIAGWLAGAEILTLPLYDIATTCFSKKTNVDMRYIQCHMQVDEEHIEWLWAGVKAIIVNDADEKRMAEVRQGVALGARATLKALDEIYEESIASDK
jgi:hypothetical protein